MKPSQIGEQTFSNLQEFDLRKYQASETALLGLLPVVKASTKALAVYFLVAPREEDGCQKASKQKINFK
uniref:Uncharacterized protein n=1 Tax=Knipowitschia caucasica TaxID=637954 RepID=A0AAV2MF22_KNICA